MHLLNKALRTSIDKIASCRVSGCLAPYRRLGIGTQMLDHVMEIVEKDGNFDSVLLHVQVNNDSAIKFYKRFGFDIVETKEQVCVVLVRFNTHPLT